MGPKDSQILQALFKTKLNYDTEPSYNGNSPPRSPRNSGHSTTVNPICVSKSSLNSLYPSKVNAIAPTYLLLEGLIYAHCERIEPDPSKCRELYLHICQFLEKCNFIGNSYQIDAFHRTRLFFRETFNTVVLNFKSSVSGFPALPSIEEPIINFSHHQLLNTGAPFTVPIEPNRWQHDFLEKELIERGGFGVVYKARHILDNVYYAVKEITFKFKTPQDF